MKQSAGLRSVAIWAQGATHVSYLDNECDYEWWPHVCFAYRHPETKLCFWVVCYVCSNIVHFTISFEYESSFCLDAYVRFANTQRGIQLTHNSFCGFVEADYRWSVINKQTPFDFGVHFKRQVHDFASAIAWLIEEEAVTPADY